MATISSKHPSYTEHLASWIKMTDCYKGQQHVKECGLEYLPATSSMHYDGMSTNQTGWKAYEAYRLRAVFPNAVRDGVEGMVGMMHRKPALIELPEALEGMRESATKSGQSLQQLLELITEQQLKVGRLGIMADWPTDAPSGTLPFITTYSETAIINWDYSPSCDDEGRTSLGFVVLNESGDMRKGLEWKHEIQFRILALSCLAAEIAGDESLHTEGSEDEYMWAVVNSDRAPIGADFKKIEGVARGQNRLTEILFEFINPCDTNALPDAPPLLGLADISLTIYRGEADYRQSLFMQGQDTLVVKGKKRAQIKEGSQTADVSEDDVRTGTGAVINLPSDGDAKYIGVESNGLTEVRLSLENDYARSGDQGARMLDSSQGKAESGEALQLRVSSRTATLPRISTTAAFALESLLKKIARAIGANDEEVKISPNKDFSDVKGKPDELLKLTQAKMTGLPISWESIHAFAARKDMSRMTWDEEQAAIALEPQPEDLGDGGDGGTEDEDDPDDQ